MVKHTVNPQLMAEAKALLEGKAPRWQLKEDKAARIEKFAVTTAPEVSELALAEAFPDEPNPPDGDLYNEQTPIERAIGEIISDVHDCTDYDEFRNPLYRHEVRQAQRRTLEHLLKMAEEPQGEDGPPPVVNQAPTAIRTAQAVLQGKLPLAEALGFSLPYDENSTLPEWADWLFDPLNILQDLSKPGARSILIKYSFDGAEEAAFLEDNLDATGLEIANRVYSTACENALKELVRLTESHSNAVSPRFLARLCAAAREELAALVAEWSAVTGGRV